MKATQQEIRSFVAGVVLSSTEGREPMSQDDAYETIIAWKDEGVEYPEGMDAWDLSSLWNEMIEK